MGEMIMSREGVALIIDDESELCLLLKKYLSRKFKKVEIATTLKEGISMAKQLSPDVVFLDNNLLVGDLKIRKNPLKNDLQSMRLIYDQ